MNEGKKLITYSCGRDTVKDDLHPDSIYPADRRGAQEGRRLYQNVILARVRLILDIRAACQQSLNTTLQNYAANLRSTEHRESSDWSNACTYAQYSDHCPLTFCCLLCTGDSANASSTPEFVDGDCHNGAGA